MKWLGCGAAGVLSMLAFTLSRDGYVGVSDLPLRAFSPVWLLYALGMAGLWFLFFMRVRRISPGQWMLGLVFGAVNYFAAALFAYDTWHYLDSFAQWGLAALHILGQAAVMAMAAALLCHWLEKAPHPEGKRLQALFARLGGGRLGRAYRRRPVLFVMGVLILCWSPYLIVFYPGTVVWDLAEMVAMQYGLRQMTTWHPVLMTWLIGGCVRFGRLFGSDNLGVFCFTMLQTLLLSYALARLLALLRRLGLGRSFRLGALLFFALTPIFASFAQAVGKDTIYASLVLLFTVQLVEWLRFERPKAAAAALFATALLMCLVRHNGLYLLLPSAGVLMLALRGRARIRAGAALAAALVCMAAFNSLLIPALGIADATASGIYSVAFQQSARTLRDHDITAEETAAIDDVLDAENLPALYEANISDPVKYTFRQYGQGRDTEQAALARYRKTWFSMLKQYPLTYLQSFVAGNTGYYAFTPKIDAARTYNNQGGIRFTFETIPAGDDPLDLHTTQIAALQRARELLAMYARGWRRVPVLELFLFCAGYTWLLIIAALSLLRQRRARDLIAFLPALLSLCACLISPVNDYFRYFLPVVCVFAPLLGVARRTAAEPRYYKSILINS